MSRFTVLGAGGFIGSALVAHLRGDGHEVDAVGRDQWPERRKDLGHVVYAIGLTADFRSRRLEVADAHVCLLARILREHIFESLLYLSSTRVYAGAGLTAENAALRVSPLEGDHLYNISKVMGESLVLTSPDPRSRVVRLSNVIGLLDQSDNFLNAVISEAAARGKVTFRTAAESERDYVGIADACNIIAAVAIGGKQRLYNIANGENVANATIARLLDSQGVESTFAPDAPIVTYPPIDIGAIRREFGFVPGSFEADFGDILSARRKSLGQL
jgi:nucleoside-diphosphate-sugar epimerase